MPELVKVAVSSTDVALLAAASVLLSFYVTARAVSLVIAFVKRG